MYVCVTDPWLEWKETSRQQEPISGVCGDLMILVGPCPLGFNPKGRLGRCHQILSDCDPGVEGKPRPSSRESHPPSAGCSGPPSPILGAVAGAKRRPRNSWKDLTLPTPGAPRCYPETIRIHPMIPSSLCIYVNATGRQRTCRLRGVSRTLIARQL